jgi:ribosomal subunit interface protein
MPRNALVVVHFKDVEVDEQVREAIQRRCDHFADEFHEVTRFELTVTDDGAGFAAHGHATGKSTDIATHAEAETPRTAVDRVLERIERQLRKVHDKRIFAPRREVQRASPKRRETL